VSKPRLLDLFSCAGGAGVGYSRAGFEVVGVDIAHQPRYPFEHHVDDALTFLEAHGREFDAVHASPPCQRYSTAASINNSAEQHPDLLDPTREALDALGKPYIIENVIGAPMRNYVTLCGTEFDLTATDVDGTLLALKRHRLFESNIWLMGAGGCQHRKHVATGSVFGSGGAYDHRTKNRSRGGYVPQNHVCAALLGIDWPMTKRELSESIPPAYTEFLGRQLLAAL